MPDEPKPKRKLDRARTMQLLRDAKEIIWHRAATAADRPAAHARQPPRRHRPPRHDEVPHRRRDHPSPHGSPAEDRHGRGDRHHHRRRHRLRPRPDPRHGGAEVDHRPAAEDPAARAAPAGLVLRQHEDGHRRLARDERRRRHPQSRRHRARCSSSAASSRRRSRSASSSTSARVWR